METDIKSLQFYEQLKGKSESKQNIIHRANLLNNKTTSLWYKQDNQDLETFNSLKHMYMTSVSKAIQ